MGRFLTTLKVQYLSERDGGRKLFALLTPLVYRSDLLGREITVPAGYVSDGESIPGALLSFGGTPSLEAGVVHDYLYQTHVLGEDEAARGLSDRVYEEAMLADGVHPVDAEKRYAGVAFWGGFGLLTASPWESGPRRLRMLAGGG